MSTIWPRERSMPLATFWFTAMSSTTKIRRAVSTSCTLAACSASAGASATCNGISNQKVLPDPGVRHCEPQAWLPALLAAADPQAHRAMGRELDRVAQQIEQDLADALFVAAHEWRQVRIELERELQAFGLRAPQAHPDRGIHQASQAERHLLDFHHPGLELGEAQDVVDDAEQRIDATADRLHALDLLGAQPASPQQRRHAQHAVEWRADLVAHGREERGLGPRSRLGRFLGGHQLGDVGIGLHHAAGGERFYLHLEHCAVWTPPDV